MAFRLSTGLRTGMLGSGGTLKDLMGGGFMDIYTGAQPTNADYIETSGATKLCRVSTTSGTGGLLFGTAAAGILPKSADTWSGVVLVTGVAGWFRFYGSAGTSGSSSSEIRFDGNIGVSGADLNLSHTSLTQNSTLTITTFNVTQPSE